MENARFTSQMTRMSKAELEQLLVDDPERAARWVAAAANEGLPEAQVRLGRMLLEGVGVPRDAKLAFAWFMRAAQAGDMDGRNMVGRCFENGWGVPQDYANAAAHFHIAAQAGLDWAQYNLAHLYLDGNGVTRDQRTAYRWYCRAAEQGHPRAMSLVGRCLEEGWGCQQDKAAALGYYQQSAQLGYFRGQYNYASLLMQQGQVDEARHWFARCVESAPLATMREVALTLLSSTHQSLHADGFAILAKCCEAGEGLDYFRYARALAQGLGCVPDSHAAHVWMHKAAALGFEPALQILGKDSNHAAGN